MKKICFFKSVFQAFLLVLISVIEVQAQESKGVDLVHVKVVASGKTEALAVTEALRSALTQTSSVFISSNTTLINDELAKDQISMINNGSIVDYKIVDRVVKDDGTVFLTCNVTVSVNRLGSFVESFGGSTELKGGIFAGNIKIIELNRMAEEKAIEDLLLVSKEILKTAFNYSITNGEPRNNNGKWEVPLTIQVQKNKNYNQFCEFFYKSIVSISMDSSALKSYLKLNLPTFSIGLFDNSNLTNSTPIFTINKLAWDSLEKDTNYLYHLLFVNQENHEYENSTFKNPKELSEIVEYVHQSIKNGDNSELGGFRRAKIFVTNTQSRYNFVNLRSERSYDLIHNFILHFSELIQDRIISNGLTTVSLVQLKDLHFTHSSYELISKKGALPITLYAEYRAEVTWLKDFISLPEDGDVSLTGLRMRCIECPFVIPGGGVDLPVEKWERVINTWRRYCINSEGEIIRREDLRAFSMKGIPVIPTGRWIKQKNVGLPNDFTESEDGMNYSVFDLVFGSYFLYHRDMSQISGYPDRTSQSMSFPLQLTMIGDDKDIVYIIELKNVLNTEDISNVKRYTIN
jgi:hypothetical protein